MPVLGGLRLVLEPADLRRRALRRRVEGFEEFLKEALKEGEALVDPRIVYEVLAVREVADKKISLEGDWVLEIGGQSPCLGVERVEKVAAMAGTIGPRLEERVSKLFSRGERLKAVVLDGIGSALVDALMDLGWGKMEAMASGEGLGTSGPLSPGMPGLPIEIQAEIVKRVPAKAIGFGITQGGVLVPRKSFTCVIFMGKGVSRWEKGEMCKVCSLRETCSYRRLA